MSENEQRPEPVIITGMEFPLRAVLRRLGMGKGSEIPGAIDTLIREERARAEGLVLPRGAYEVLTVTHNSGDQIRFDGHDFILKSRPVSRMLAGCRKAVIFMVTIGPALESAVRELSDSGEISRAFILDAVGSEMADLAARTLHRRILSRMAGRSGYAVTPRFSPGYGDWPLDVQPALLGICGGERIGISVTPSCFLVPRKSVSAVFGWKRKEA